jgi:hypothetical protein
MQLEGSFYFPGIYTILHSFSRESVTNLGPQAMEELIKQAFIQVDVLGPHVVQGHYDLMSPDGEIILPSIWGKVGRPGMMITMNIWSIDKSPPPGVLKAPIPPRHVPTNVPGLRPPVPARWEVKAGASGRPYRVDNNTGTTHRTSPGDGSHQRSGTPATPPIPSAPQSTAPGQVPAPRRGVETSTDS